MPIRFVTTEKPLLVAEAIGDQSDDEYIAFLKECSRLMFSDDEPYVYVYDGSRIGRMAPGQRRLQADWINLHAPSIRRYNLGVAFVFSSALTRGLLQAVHWLSPPPYEFAVLDTLPKAKAWAEGRLTSVRATG